MAGRHLSEFVKQSTIDGGLGEFIITALLKHDYPTQDKLAKVAIGHQLTKRQATKLFKAYDENPQIDLDEYVKEVKGTKQVEIVGGSKVARWGRWPGCRGGLSPVPGLSQVF